MDSSAAGPTQSVSSSSVVNPNSQQVVAPRACLQCRTRKVKCDRAYPKCQECRVRNVAACDYGQLVPAHAAGAATSDDQVRYLEQRIVDLERQITTLHQASSPRRSTTPTAFAESMWDAFLAASSGPDELVRFLQDENTPTRPFHATSQVGESSVEWRLARSTLASALTVHLTTAFFSSCCAFLPAFEPWLGRAQSLYAQPDQLRPAARVATAAFCAMGARTSPHSQLLGIPVCPPEDVNSTKYVMAAGQRRERAYQVVRARALDLCYELSIDSDVSVENVEVLLTMMQMIAFDEMPPKKARTFCRSAYGMYCDLLSASEIPTHIKDDLEARLGLPLLLGDAVTAAGVHLPPLISTSEVAEYFPSHRLPDIRSDQLLAELEGIFPPDEDSTLHHEGLKRALDAMLRWLVSANRYLAHLAGRLTRTRSLLRLDTVRPIWRAVDQIQSAVRRLQSALIGYAGVPIGCAGHGCADLHCRMYTRLERNADDLTASVHTLVQAQAADQWIRDESDQQLVQECDRRIRRALKLVAFNFKLYVSSRDPHQTYHLVFHLESIPDWPSIALQRYGCQPGPESPELELSPTELRWLENGLAVAAFYTASAETRLEEIRRGRQLDPFLPLAMPRLPFPSAVESALRSAAAQTEGQQWESLHTTMAQPPMSQPPRLQPPTSQPSMSQHPYTASAWSPSASPLNVIRSGSQVPDSNPGVDQSRAVAREHHLSTLPAIALTAVVHPGSPTPDRTAATSTTGPASMPQLLVSPGEPPLARFDPWFARPQDVRDQQKHGLHLGTERDSAVIGSGTNSSLWQRTISPSQAGLQLSHAAVIDQSMQGGSSSDAPRYAWTPIPLRQSSTHEDCTSRIWP